VQDATDKLLAVPPSSVADEFRRHQGTEAPHLCRCADDAAQSLNCSRAMVFMVTDVLREAEQVGNIETLRQDEPATYAVLERLYRRILDLVATQPELAACVSVPADGETAPFSITRDAP
jgi:hypothetical protein